MISDYLVKWLFEFKCRNSYLNVDDMIVYVTWMIIFLLIMNLHAKSYICGYVMFFCKIDEEWSCGWELWVNSWLFIVDVVLEHVVDELISWVSLFVMRIVVVVENLWKFGELLNFGEMVF